MRGGAWAGLALVAGMAAAAEFDYALKPVPVGPEHSTTP